MKKNRPDETKKPALKTGGLRTEGLKTGNLDKPEGKKRAPKTFIVEEGDVIQTRDGTRRWIVKPEASK